MCLGEISFDDLKKWCHENLTKSQRKQIGNDIKKVKTGVYLYTADGGFVAEFGSVRSVSTYLKCPYQSAIASFKRKTLLYKNYFITKTKGFDPKPNKDTRKMLINK